MAKYRILLADSNNQFQTTVRDYLTAQEGIERVDAVSDGQSALDAMNNNRYVCSCAISSCRAWTALSSLRGLTAAS